MQITVKLFAEFRIGRFKVSDMDFPEGTDCGNVITSLGINVEDIGVILVDGRHAEIDQMLKQGQVIAIFPLVGGG